MPDTLSSTTCDRHEVSVSTAKGKEGQVQREMKNGRHKLKRYELSEEKNQKNVAWFICGAGFLTMKCGRVVCWILLNENCLFLLLYGFDVVLLITDTMRAHRKRSHRMLVLFCLFTPFLPFYFIINDTMENFNCISSSDAFPRVSVFMLDKNDRRIDCSYSFCLHLHINIYGSCSVLSARMVLNFKFVVTIFQLKLTSWLNSEHFYFPMENATAQVLSRKLTRLKSV